jgi:hypothetical protein
MEFTDLFVAIARAAGIPAREAIGYAYTNNPDIRPLSLVLDVLHSWPEYYDREHRVWIPVDPTWGNTTGGVNYFDKLDFDHIVFAIHGISSTYPYPAGFYRENGKTGKSIDVVFTDREVVNAPAKFSLNIDFPKTITAGFTGSGSINITNNTGLAVDKADISVNITPFNFSRSTVFKRIPPYATISYPISVNTGSYLTRGNGQVSATVNGQNENYNFVVRPMYWIAVPGFIIALVIITACLFIMKKTRIWKMKKKS